jgi:hypothetical protein
MTVSIQIVIGSSFVEGGHTVRARPQSRNLCATKFWRYLRLCGRHSTLV